MERISEYGGCFLNHLEAFYRPNDRDLLVELMETLGLSVSEIQFTASSRPTLAVHPNALDRDPTNNVMFLYEMPAVQQRLVDIIEERFTSDPHLAAAVADYRDAASRMPPIMPHFGLRFGSSEKLERVLNQLTTVIATTLAERVSVWEVPPYAPIEGLPDIRQVFVRTNLFSLSVAAFDQAIELQVDRARA